MARVTICFIGNLDTTSEAISVVADDAAYVAACKDISESARSNHGLEIWVRSKRYLSWLRNYIGQLGIEADFTEKTPRSILAQRWHVAIPDWVRDEAISSQGLLGLEVDEHAGTSFEDVLLAQVLDRAFAVESLGADNAAIIVTGLAGSTYREAITMYPLVIESVKRKTEQWKRNSSEKWISAICDQLPGNPLVPLRWFGAWSLLRNYPDELLERIIPVGQLAVVRNIPAKAVLKVTLEFSVREEALDQIRLYMEQAVSQVNSNDGFRKVLAGMSGRLAEEYAFALRMLKAGMIDPQLEDIEAVQKIFDTCPGVTRSQLQALRYLVRPRYPALIGEAETWSAGQWAQWTIEEYAPYREWQVRNGKFDTAIESAVGKFSDWYVQEYLGIHADVNLGLTYCLNGLQAGGDIVGLTVVLIVDCLPLAFAPLVDDALRTAGFNPRNRESRFAALPTVTEFNKAALISGNSEQVSANYAALLAERSDRDWGGVRTLYSGSLKGLSDLQPGPEPTIVVMNFIEGDELLHSDVESKNRTYEEELSRVYAQLAEAAYALCERWPGSREDISVILVTDHGACRILDEEATTFDSNVVNKLFEDEKHRMATMSAGQAASVPANLWELGYRFSSPFSAPDLVHFLPRGHNTVLKAGTGKGYHHGGVTPEEVVVPFARYGLTAMSYKKPVTRFVNIDLNKQTNLARFFIQRVVGIKIEVQNPNSVPLQVTAIEALAPEAAIKDVRIAELEPAGIATIRIDLYFQKSALAADALELNIRYLVDGAEHELALSLPAEFKSATAPGLNLRNL
jgi:hypothetical protein